MFSSRLVSSRLLWVSLRVTDKKFIIIAENNQLLLLFKNRRQSLKSEKHTCNKLFTKSYIKTRKRNTEQPKKITGKQFINSKKWKMENQKIMASYEIIWFCIEQNVEVAFLLGQSAW